MRVWNYVTPTVISRAKDGLDDEMVGDILYIEASSLPEGEEINEESYEIALASFQTEEAKVTKVTALSTLTVTTTSGKVFDGDETARIDMLTAINMAGLVGQTSTMWKLADNSIAEVTLAEMQEALLLALTKKGEIIGALNV